MNKLIAITGGIGCGKSVVARLLAVLGYPVYDTDANARRIMDTSDAIKASLTAHFGSDVVTDGQINRPLLARIVFKDTDKLAILNSLVHKAVIDDVLQWQFRQTTSLCFVETAILYESGLDRQVDGVWEVTAPTALRIARIVARGNGTMTADQARQRVDSQLLGNDDTRIQRHPDTHVILNDDVTPLLPKVLALL